MRLQLRSLWLSITQIGVYIFLTIKVVSTKTLKGNFFTLFDMCCLIKMVDSAFYSPNTSFQIDFWQHLSKPHRFLWKRNIKGPFFNSSRKSFKKFYALVLVKTRAYIWLYLHVYPCIRRSIEKVIKFWSW